MPNDFLVNPERQHPESCPLPKEFLDRLNVAIDLIAIGTPANHALAAAMVRRKDFDYVLRFHPEISERIDQARAQAIEYYKQQIRSAGQRHTRKRTIRDKTGAIVNTVEEEVDGDWKANSWLLERFDKENFGPNMGGITVNLEISQMIQQTVKELNAANGNATIEDVQDADFHETEESDPTEEVESE